MTARALIVDDYPSTAEAISILLEMFGYETRVSTSGKGAIAEAMGFDPTLVILDIGLSDMTGYEVARSIRRSLGARPYIAALTGWSKPEKRRLATEAGCDDYVVKPADAAMLRSIAAAADRHHACK